MGGDKAGDPNGFDWNLSDMENSTVAFHGTRLLTLSACSTAKDYRSRNGLEMDGLGMVAQQKEAEAVLATLWDVNDLSTSHIMSDFYARWVRKSRAGQSRSAAPGPARLPARRRSHLTQPSHRVTLLLPPPAAELHRARQLPSAQTGRGFQTSEAPAATQSSLGYAHPYYWAPFVLIGNFQ